jgi:hypothetical protein
MKDRQWVRLNEACTSPNTTATRTHSAANDSGKQPGCLPSATKVPATLCKVQASQHVGPQQQGEGQFVLEMDQVGHFCGASGCIHVVLVLTSAACSCASLPHTYPREFSF